MLDLEIDDPKACKGDLVSGLFHCGKAKVEVASVVAGIDEPFEQDCEWWKGL